MTPLVRFVLYVLGLTAILVAALIGFEVLDSWTHLLGWGFAGIGLVFLAGVPSVPRGQP